VVAVKSKTGMKWLQDRMAALDMDSLEQAAAACGINRGSLYRYFSFEQRPSIDVLPLLCSGLQASPLEVLRALNIQID
jgi:transcriptional regulator with XRE-family HTH domain